jgi:hypothetical protein
VDPGSSGKINGAIPVGSLLGVGHGKKLLSRNKSTNLYLTITLFGLIPLERPEGSLALNPGKSRFSAAIRRTNFVATFAKAHRLF